MDTEDEKKPLEQFGIKIPDDLAGLFGDPPLLDGEQPHLYWALLAAMVKDRKPQSFPEWIYVYDMVSNLWEEVRLKRASAGLMQGEMFNALTYFLTDIYTDGRPSRKLPKDLAFQYFSEDPEEREEVASLLARYGVTPAALQAKAVQQNSDAIQMFENMSWRRKKDRRKHRQEDESLRRRRQSETKSRKSKADADGD